MIEGVIFTPLSIIDTEGGDVLHAMKSGDPGFFGFGESYFSTIESDLSPPQRNGSLPNT